MNKSGLGIVESELKQLYRALDGVTKYARKETKKAFREPGLLMAAAIAGRAPISERVHYRNNSDGKRVAEYHPGNLRRSIKILNIKTSVAVIVGPKIDKQGSKGVFKGSRTDAYYAHFVEFGAPAIGLPPTPFVAPAVTAVGGTVLRLMVESMKQKIDQYTP